MSYLKKLTSTSTLSSLLYSIALSIIFMLMKFLGASILVFGKGFLDNPLNCIVAK